MCFIMNIGNTFFLFTAMLLVRKCLEIYKIIQKCCSQIIGIIWPTVYYRYMTAKNMAYLWSALTIIFGAVGIVARIKRKPKFLLYVSYISIKILLKLQISVWNFMWYFCGIDARCWNSPYL